MTERDNSAARVAARAVSVSGGMTITDGAAAMVPPMPRRELARRLRGVAAIGQTYGAKGRRAAAYPVGEILKAHAAWLREKAPSSRTG